LVPEGDAEVIAEAMNVDSVEARRRLTSSGGSWSSTPTSEEVPYGQESEEVPYGQESDETKGGGLDLIGYIAVGAGVLLLVGAVAGFVYVRSITKDGTSTPPHVELTGGKPDLFDDPFEGRGRVNSLNPLEDNVMYSNPMER
jgi:hypothetical protein